MNRLILISSILLLAGCELILDVKVREEKKRITVNSFFWPDSIWVADVTLSDGPLFNDAYLEYIQNAVVVVSNGNNVIDTLVLDSGSYREKWDQYGNVDTLLMGRYKSKNRIKPVAGQTFEITASAENIEPVQASSYIPLPVAIDSVEVSYLGEYYAGERPHNHLITATFQDDPATSDYYELFVVLRGKWYRPEHEDSVEYVYPVYNFAEKGYYSQGRDGEIIFDDSKLNGKKISVNIKANFYPDNVGEAVEVRLRSLSKDLYNYRITLGLQNETSGDPLAQPVNVYNNVNHGFGIFAGYSQSAYLVKE